MASAVTTGCLLSLMSLYFVLNSVASSARGGHDGDSWTRGRRFSPLAHHQRLAGDESRETVYDSLLRRKRDSAVNGGGSDVKLNDDGEGRRGGEGRGEGGGVDGGAKWVDSGADDRMHLDFPKDEDIARPSSDEAAAAKRKWSEKNVRIWGKRKWSSKGLHMWGKRGEDAPVDGADMERPLEEGVGIGGWADGERQKNQGYGWEKDEDELKKKRQRWAKNNLKIWGKRNAEQKANDLEGGRVRALEKAAVEEEEEEEEAQSNGFQGTSAYGNRGISGHPQKRNNPPNYGVEQKWGKKGWANNNVRIWG